MQTKQHPAETLEALARALRTTDRLGGAFYYDRQTRTVVPLIVDPEDLEDGPAPAWAEDEHALAESIAADPDRWCRVEPMGDPGRLRRFLAGVDEPELRADLEAAARGGRGAYRRVRTALRRAGLEHRWHRFEEAADTALALRWLAEHDR